MKRQIEVEQSVFVVRCGWSKGEVAAGLRHFRSAPENGHRQRGQHV